MPPHIIPTPGHSAYVLPPPCDHKVQRSCMLTALPCCCSCADRRPEATSYPIYIDGQGIRMKGRRWQRYCRKCYDYFEAAHNRPSRESAAAHASLNTNVSELPQAVVESGVATAQPSLPDGNDVAARRARRRQWQRTHYPLGNREDVQEETYESPLAGMFTRAYARYNDAEEIRAIAQMIERQELEGENNVESIVHNAHMLAIASPNQHQAPLSPFRFGQPRLSRRHFHAQFYNPAPVEEPSRSFGEEQPSSQHEGNLIDRQSQRPEPKPLEDLKVDFGCKVCREQKIDSITLPCMQSQGSANVAKHAAMCHWCADIWKDSARDQNGRFNHGLWTCIVCRKQIKEQRRFYL